MTNLTISLDEAIVRRARIRAIQQGTSLSAKVREFLAAYAAGVSQRGAVDPTTDLMRMMAVVRGEIAQYRKPATAARASKASKKSRSPTHRTLREEMYEGDFRARARVEAAAPPTPGRSSR